jgi:hypothetical protein
VGGDSDETPTTFVGRASLPSVVTPTRSFEEDAYSGPVMLPAEKPRSLLRLAWIAFAVIGGFALIGIVTVVATESLLSSHPPAPGNHQAAVAPTTTQSTTSPAPTAGLHSPVSDGSLQFTVNSVQCGQPNVSTGIFDRSAHGQYCLVQLTVKNIGQQGWAFTEQFQKAVDRNGRTYQPDITAGLIVNGNGAALFSTLQPGDTVNGTMVYDIPKNATVVKLVLHDSPISGGVTVPL